jgi:hypothetical protein
MVARHEATAWRTGKSSGAQWVVEALPVPSPMGVVQTHLVEGFCSTDMDGSACRCAGSGCAGLVTRAVASDEDPLRRST